MPSERELILRGMTAVELALYRAAGGRVPHGLRPVEPQWYRPGQRTYQTWQSLRVNRTPRQAAEKRLIARKALRAYRKKKMRQRERKGQRKAA